MTNSLQACDTLHVCRFGLVLAWACTGGYHLGEIVVCVHFLCGWHHCCFQVSMNTFHARSEWQKYC